MLLSRMLDNCIVHFYFIIAEKYTVFVKVGHTQNCLLSYDEQKCSGRVNHE
jgi:hypothetical protein